ncbi:unnamed protein product [Aphanomyces euteiches]
MRQQFTVRLEMTSAPPLVPLPVLFGNAEYAMPQISPDGTQIAFLTAASNGVMNIFLQPVGAKSAEPVQVTTEDNRPIRFFRWAVTGTHLLYVQDMNGNERFHLYVVDLTTMTTVNRTPFESAKVLTTFPMTSWYNYINRLTSSRCPNEVVIGLNTRIPTLFDVHRVNILTGETTLVATNPGKVDAWIEYYYYDRTTKEATLLALERPALKDYSFSPMKPVEIPCRDGETMVGYLTLPRGAPATNLPLVLNVHGGPWSHDVWGFNPLHQWQEDRVATMTLAFDNRFASRGYACLSVNYRGSDGYGMRWLNLGNGEWGRRMQDDLTDAVEWAVQSGVVDKSRVAIYGRSNGGYAALAGLAFTPDVYACGVDVVGPSNIKTLLAATPPDWDHMRKVFAVRIGNVLEDDEVNMRMSSLFHVDKVKKPLLIGQGANDPRVAQSESDQIARELHRRHHDVTYIVYPDEGHGFHRPPNNIDFCQRTEAFLATHLHGRCDPGKPEATATNTAIVVDLSTL